MSVHSILARKQITRRSVRYLVKLSEINEPVFMEMDEELPQVKAFNAKSDQASGVFTTCALYFTSGHYVCFTCDMCASVYVDLGSHMFLNAMY